MRRQILKCKSFIIFLFTSLILCSPLMPVGYVNATNGTLISNPDRLLSVDIEPRNWGARLQQKGFGGKTGSSIIAVNAEGQSYKLTFRSQKKSDMPLLAERDKGKKFIVNSEFNGSDWQVWLPGRWDIIFASPGREGYGVWHIGTDGLNMIIRESKPVTDFQVTPSSLTFTWEGFDWYLELNSRNCFSGKRRLNVEVSPGSTFLGPSSIVRARKNRASCEDKWTY